MQFIFATVPNQVANNQVLTVEFLSVLQESNISMYQEFTEGHSFSQLQTKLTLSPVIWNTLDTTYCHVAISFTSELHSEPQLLAVVQHQS